MSFGGAECSTGANPLAQLSKHVQKDGSLMRERLAPGLAGQLPIDGSLRSTPQEMAAADKAMMDNFFAQEQAAAAGDPFAMEAIRREISLMQAGPTAAPQMPVHQHHAPIAAPQNWAAEFGPEQQHARVHSPAGFDAAEFASFQAPVQSPAAGQHQHAHQHQRPYFRPQGYNMLGGLRLQGMQGMPQHQAPVVQGKGKEKMVELDDQNWEKQFAELELSGRELSEEEQAAAIERELNEQGAAFEDFESVWKGIEADQAENGMLDTNWLDEFDSTKTWTPQDSMTTTLPNMGEYTFEPENPYADLKNAFEEGKRILESGGNLSLAALAFEAAVQQDPKHVEAWTLLGAAQAQNEKEAPAIRALETAVRLDEKNLQALMDLAVSYTNEGYDSSAYNTLERWLLAKYPQLTPATPANSEQERIFTRERVTDLFLQAAQLSPDGQVVDSDVQVGLGVLFYGAEEYDKAVDCFSVALQFDYDARLKNHLLWNRLGATLANSGRPEEAINAYEKALEINPNFVRARYNLGVSCINIGCFEEAAQHLLGALSMHKVARDKASEQARDLGIDPVRILHNESTNLYDTLRRVFGQMGRRDLAERVVAGMDVDSFRNEFDF